MHRSVFGLPLKYYTPEDIQRIADTTCEVCGKTLRECQCPDEEDE